MKPNLNAVTAVLILAAAFIEPANAEYRCNPPPTVFDRNACEAAAESPTALRRYVTRMQGITNLRFADYVNRATVEAWQAAGLVPGPDSAEVAPVRASRASEPADSTFGVMR